MKLCGVSKSQVQKGGEIKLAGARFTSGTRVVYSIKSGGKRVKHTVKATLIGSTRLTAKVPLNALSGHIYARVRGGRKTNAKALKIVKPPRTGPQSAPAKGTAFEGDGQWIWQMEKSDGGDPNAIIARAKAAGIETLFIKSGDGDTYWDQFSPELVNALHAGGIKVCAWQFVYGKHPNEEAAAAVRAIHSGADCFVIDAESEYEHDADRYANAATYLSDIRADPQVGPNYPIGLTGFPYVDLHSGFPYSTFLGPGGAQFNLPQVYWHSIGDTVDASMAHTYADNLPYNRPIAPIGQTYGTTSTDAGPSAEELQRFRQLTAALGSTGLSWWSYQETDDNEWATLATDPGPFVGPPPAIAWVQLKKGSKGDLVVWAQRLLTGAGQSPGTIDGDYGPGTQTAVTNFQTAHGLPATGQIDTATWQQLIKAPPSAKTISSKRAAKAKAAPRAARAAVPADAVIASRPGGSR
jgi:hypothetical protein